MQRVHVTNVLVGNNNMSFNSMIPLKIEFSCEKDFSDKVIFSVIYSVGSAQKDQVLAKQLVGPFRKGKNSTIIKANAPDHKKMKKEDVFGNGALLISGYYNNQRFITIGYVVNNDIPDNIDKTKLTVSNIKRNVFSSKPRVTRYEDIKWDSTL